MNGPGCVVRNRPQIIFVYKNEFVVVDFSHKITILQIISKNNTKIELRIMSTGDYKG